MPSDYVVQRGDTLTRIAQRNGLTLTELAAANPQLNTADLLHPGQVIRIPDAMPRRYVIQPGDTFYDIAKRFNVKVQDLQTLNPGVRPERLFIGQTIVLPVSKGEFIVDTTIPYGFQELSADLRQLAARYSFLETVIIGYSVLNKPIYAVKLGGGPNIIHYNGSIHANEWITASMLMKFIEDFSSAYTTGRTFKGKDTRRLFQATSLWIAPMLNPDGVELVQEGPDPRSPQYRQLLEWNNGSYNFSGWKANIRGVDLNDQFPAHWEEEKARRGTAGPGPRDYPGTAPLTEPEVKALAAFTRNNPFRQVIAFHTQGEEIYYTYRGLQPPESTDIANRYSRVSGYTPIDLSESDAGYKDWFIQDFRRPGFTIESGKGVNPLPITDFPAIYDRTVGIMLEGMEPI
ncbi:M14 family zinc carboxypeptidase [Gorillibacterium massiliense]|uniref:M14 family zinc carboxypeptidase n=1 Tax=Gorillibacterium massiliense TaxID=1280390 RepID=UPI0004B527D0|nr:M14 family zinc carboxypeptidase [Gorillibacterium massiliense]